MFSWLLNLLRKAYRACELSIYRVALALHRRRGEVDGISLLLPKDVLSTQMAYALLRDGIDGEDRRLLARYAHPGDFVLNLGGGCGLSAMSALRQVRPNGAVVIVEPDPLVHDLARRNFRLNGMDEIESRAAAAVVDRQTKQITFYRKKNYYGSNLLHNDGVGQPLTVPAVFPPDLIPPGRSGQKILLCDIEGYEASLLANAEIIDCFDLIITELHFAIFPKTSASPYARMFEVLSSRGFKLVDIDDEGFVFQKQRNHSPGR